MQNNSVFRKKATAYSGIVGRKEEGSSMAGMV